MVSDFHIPELDYCNMAAFLDESKSFWADGFVAGPHGSIPRIKTVLNIKDWLGALKVRFGIKRNGYSINPGLYAVGNPDKSSPVLITANYKLTFDMLRRELSGINAWIVVVDSKGINVWCAAGKGSFGTYEVIKKIKELKLKDLVSHRTIILPQLCAPGVSAFEVYKNSGFRAVFGPVRSVDIKEFLRSSLKATKEMRTVTFHAVSRLVLVPVEVVHSIKLLLIMLFAVLIYNAAGLRTIDFAVITKNSLQGFIPLAASVLTGCIAVPLLLPYIPFRAFSLKGLAVGMALAALLLIYRTHLFILADSWLLWSYLIILPAVTGLLALNFTGSTTYTSFSGVKKETRLALPAFKAMLAVGIALAIVSLLI